MYRSREMRYSSPKDMNMIMRRKYNQRNTFAKKFLVRGANQNEQDGDTNLKLYLWFVKQPVYLRLLNADVLVKHSALGDSELSSPNHPGYLGCWPSLATMVVSISVSDRPRVASSGLMNSSEMVVLPPASDIFNGFEDYSLKYDLWIGDPNLCLFTFERYGTNLTLTEQLIYVSRDGGNTRVLWRPTFHNNPIYVDEIIPMNDVLFAVSKINKTYFYADKQLNVFSFNRYEQDAILVPSLFDSAYIY
ncbi:hypothetical protein RF11_10979 [Thelohanellus kitauei]|uniref:Uncharacterized protein n=1 Tax=Thelohanellus kitauei TaxID=669202 RepID=A0A0C2MHB1_THEKT|nr:hypothetical protein RF11_10979 [Thelohanellus kitauei]